jgi:phosphate starvation-inducible PhoH-like protein
MARRKKQQEEDFEMELVPHQRLLNSIKVNFTCKTERQKDFVKLIQSEHITFCTGPAGTGKTYVACAEALRLLKAYPHIYKKIIIAKSVTVLEGEDVGYLKGSLKEKMEPFMISFMDNFHKIIGESLSITLLDVGIIQVLPLAYIRGRSIDNAIIIVDEAQNISLKNMRSTMTRLGENSKIVIVGDTKQIDIKKSEVSSLEKVVDWFKDTKGIGVTSFKKEDIVRHPLIIEIEEVFDANS